jgi:hypothetical protein
MVLAPHVQWLFATGFTTFTYATALHANAPLAEVLWKDAVYVVEAVAYVSVLIACYWIAVRPDMKTLRETFRPSNSDARMLVVLLVVPLLLPAIVAPLIGAVLTPLWTMSAWFLLPIVLLRPKAAELTRVAAITSPHSSQRSRFALWLRRHGWRGANTLMGPRKAANFTRRSARRLQTLGTARQACRSDRHGQPLPTSGVTFYSPITPIRCRFTLGTTAPWSHATDLQTTVGRNLQH